MYLQALFMTVHLLMFLEASEYDELPDVKVKMKVVYSDGSTNCADRDFSPFFMECSLEHPKIAQYVPIVPTVRWFYRKNSDYPFVNLYNDPEKRFVDIFPENTCYRASSSNGTSYKCEYSKKWACSPRYDGHYKCEVHVVLYDNTELFYNASDRLVGKSESDQLDHSCFIPKVTAFRAQLSGNSSIVLDWDTSSLPPGEIYCDRSRRFSVRIFTYDDFYDFQRNQSSFISTFINTTKRRETNFNLSITAQYSVDKFYIFQIRNQVLRGRVQDGTVLESTHLYNSEVFYFGNREPVRLVSPSERVEKISVLMGNSVKLQCEAVGFPLPTTTMWFENNLIEPSRSSLKLPTVSRTFLAEASNAGRYECSTVGHFLSPNGGAFIKSDIKYIVLEVYEEDTSSLLCSTPAQSSNCSRFFNNHNVLQNLSNQDTNFDLSINTIISSLAKVASRLSGAEARCLEAAQAVVCHSSYPFCFNQDTSRKVCKSACDLFRSGGPCADVIDPQIYPEAHKIIFSSCDNQTDSAGDYPECIHVPFQEREMNEDASWCSIGRGIGYAGEVKRTSSGYICQDWISQTPHKHAVYSGEDLHNAVNQCRNPQGRGTRPWCYTGNVDIRWEYCDNVPQCETCVKYTETFCKDLVGYDEGGYVFLNQHESQWNQRGLANAELWMNRVWHNLGIAKLNLSESCHLGLKELLCHKTMPLCSSSSQGDNASSKKLCSDHCSASKLFGVCPGNLVNKMETEMKSRKVIFSQPDCSVDTKSNSATCLASQAFLLATANLVAEDDACYEPANHGQKYNGTIATTSSGKVCQPWGSLLPEALNYCRNPGQVAQSPWCYVNDTAWEYCDVPVCQKTSITEPLMSTESVGISGRGITAILFCIIIGVVVIGLGILIGFVACRRKKRYRKRSIHKIATHSSQWDYVRNETYQKVEEPRTPIMTSKLEKAIQSFPQYKKASVHYVRQIGQGNFGVVFYGKAEGVQPDEKVTEVAVKTLKEECSEALEDFVREAKLMFSFDHENIVKILGVAMDSAPYYLIFEYMDKGDLAHFLRSNASSAQRRLMAPFDGRPRSRTESNLSHEPPSLSPEQLTDICKQIACGMRYLAKENHIHRDLACRNCLVKSSNTEQTESGLVIKIGDFGMSHNLYTSDYYRVKGSAILPVRWMSPEAIIYGKFSTESDVWSFGVVMWEVFSFAMQPYYGTSNEEVTEAIRRHKILKQPADCSSSMYEIMKQCWNQQPRLRPSFSELYKELDEFRASVSSGGSPSIDYFNNDSSDLDSDAFLEENSVDELDATI